MACELFLLVASRSVHRCIQSPYSGLTIGGNVFLPLIKLHRVKFGRHIWWQMVHAKVSLSLDCRNVSLGFDISKYSFKALFDIYYVWAKSSALEVFLMTFFLRDFKSDVHTLQKPVKLKLQHPSPPGNPPGIWDFKDWLVQIPSPRGVQIPHQLVLKYLSSEANFVFNHTLFTLFRERSVLDDTFKLLLKTLLNELFANKGKILSCKSVIPCKNWDKYSK